MDQDRIDHLVEELEAYLPMSAQALLQELIAELKVVPKTSGDAIQDNINFLKKLNSLYSEKNNLKTRRKPGQN